MSTLSKGRPFFSTGRALTQRTISFIPVILAVLLLSGGCGGAGSGNLKAKAGDLVKVDYTGRLADGKVFDSSQGRTPLEFTVGGGQMIKGFDAAIPGMETGQTKTVTIPAAEAYGAYQPELVVTVPKSNFPPSFAPVIGQNLTLSNGMAVKVTAVTATDVTLDANHELAGKDLTFDITLIAIVPPAT
jgi:peptidylprolyl isomerase